MRRTTEQNTAARETDRFREAVRVALAVESRLDYPEEQRALFDDQTFDSEGFIKAAGTHGLAGLVAHHARAIGVPPSVRLPLQELAVSQTIAAMSSAQATVEVWCLLQREGIPTIAFKGPTLSAQTTGTTTARGGGDVDLLVAPANIPRAFAALSDSGWTPWVSPGVVGSWWRWFEAANREVTFIGERSTVDLHWRIPLENGFFPPAADMIERAVPVELHGSTVLGLSSDDLLLASAYAFQLDHFASLRYAVDVIRILRSRQTPVHYPRSQQEMVLEAACAAVALVGGLDPRHCSGLGLRIQAPSRSAISEWQKYGVYGRRPLATRPIGQIPAVARHRRYTNVPTAWFHGSVTRALSRPDLPTAGSTPPGVGRLVRVMASGAVDLLRKRSVGSSNESVTEPRFSGTPSPPK